MDRVHASVQVGAHQCAGRCSPVCRLSDSNPWEVGSPEADPLPCPKMLLRALHPGTAQGSGKCPHQSLTQSLPKPVWKPQSSTPVIL